MKKVFIGLISFGAALIAQIGVGGSSLGIYSLITNRSFSSSTSDATPDEQDTPEQQDQEQQQLPVNYSPSSFKFECENMTLIGGAVAGEQRGADPNNPSGGSFAGELNNKIGAGVTFEFTSDLDTISKFIVCVGRRSDKDFNLKSTFALTVNAYEESINSVAVGKCDSSVSYFDWTEFTVSYVHIKKGVNEIEFVTKSLVSSNIDYFRFDTYANLAFHQGE